MHVWYFFLMLGEGIRVLAVRSKKARFVASARAVSVVPFLLLWARFRPHQARLGATDWMPVTRRSFFVEVFTAFYGGMKWGLLLLAAVLLICHVNTKRAQIHRWLEQREFRALAAVALTSVMVPLAISFVRPIYWPGRYTRIALPALAALLGGSVSRLVHPVGAAVYALAGLLVVVIFHVRTRTEVLENSAVGYREAESDKRAVMELCPRLSPRDTLLFTGLSRAGVEYYLRRLDCGRDVVPGQFPCRYRGSHGVGPQ